jgi:hypothetical protein
VIQGPLFLASVALLMSTPVNADGAPEVREAKAPPNEWRGAFASAERYARGRLGRVSFALVDDRGRVRGYHAALPYQSASLVKAMLLVAYLNHPNVRRRRLDFGSRALLRPMITRSDNRAASRVRAIVGNPGLAALARRAGMRHFATSVDWGATQVAAGDQARFFAQIDALVPPRHRRYARGLLSQVMAAQSWGIPESLPSGARAYFKGGWRPEGSGWLVHQGALVESGDRRVALAVLTDDDRDERYGRETIRGVARRALRPLARP